MFGVCNNFKVRNLRSCLGLFLLGDSGRRAFAVAAGRPCLLGEELEVVLESLVGRLQLASVHRIDEGKGSEDTVKAVADCLGQVKVTLSFLFFNNAVDYVLSTAQEDLALEQILDMLVVAHHLQKLDAHVFLGSRRLVHGSQNGAEVAHVNTSFVQEVFKALRVDRDSLLLLQILHQARDRLLGDVLCQVLHVLLLLLEFVSGHVELDVFL